MGGWFEALVEQVGGSGGGSPSGPAGGDLAGTYPNPTIKPNVDLTGTPTSQQLQIDPASDVVALEIKADNLFSSPAISVDDTAGDSVVIQIIPSSAVFLSAGMASGSSFNFGLSASDASLTLTDGSGGIVFVDTNAGAPSISLTDSSSRTIVLSPTGVGFFSAAPVGQQTITGAKLPGDTVMENLLTALAALGLIVDSTE